MVTAGDFRNGVTFEEDGNVMQIVEFQHVKPGKGAAFVRAKVRNVILLLKRHTIQQLNSQQHMLRERIWSILTMTVIFIISWIQRAMSLFQ